jgi:hypothetical protein
VHNFDVSHDEKMMLFRHTSGGNVPIGWYCEDTATGTIDHTAQCKSKKGKGELYDT